MNIISMSQELELPYIEVAATELVCGISGESESKIRDLFDEAIKNAPCILFLDEIDAICPKRELTERGMERRMVAQLLKCLDGKVLHTHYILFHVFFSIFSNAK